MSEAILALNAGSSSVKFSLYAIDGAALDPIVRGELDSAAVEARFIAHDAKGNVLHEQCWAAGTEPAHNDQVNTVLTWVETHLGDENLIAVGHRVVHGGREFTTPVLLTGSIIKALDDLTPLAPLHQPASMAPIHAIASLRPELPQVACFDTAFHHNMPRIAQLLAIPHSYADEGVRRYGFHGLSYEYVAARLRTVAPALATGRVVVAHLGNGASLCAMNNGQSVDTTMGFTALDGLVMGTRCGTLDAGVVLYMMQHQHLGTDQIEDILYRRSGLLGVSGLSSDMRVLLASSDPRARDAVDLFTFRVARETAAMAASLGGIDGLVFTAGIGEHAAEIRTRVCERLRWLGVREHSEGPGAPGAPDDRSSGSVEVLVIATDEEVMIGQHTRDLLRATSDGASRTITTAAG